MRRGYLQTARRYERNWRYGSDEIRLSDHLDVIGAASAHPAVGGADDGYPSVLRLFDNCLSGVIHRQHADVIAAIVKGRYLRFAQNLHCITRARETPMLGNVQDLRETGIFITAQSRVDHMVGDDPGFLGVIADAPQCTLRMIARLLDAQSNSVEHFLGPYSGASRSSGSGPQRSTGLRAARVSSRRRRGVETGPPGNGEVRWTVQT